LKAKVGLVLVVLMISIATSEVRSQDYWFYDSDSTKIVLSVLPDLVTIKLSDSSGIFSTAFAQSKPYLSNDYDSELLGSRFGTYRLEAGYLVEDVMAELRLDPDVVMVNPVISMTGADTVYLSNTIVTVYHATVTQSEADALNSLHGLTEVRLIDLDTTAIVHVLELNSTSNKSILEVCNEYWESGLCFAAIPNYACKHAFFGLPSDPYYVHQWPYHNTGQNGGMLDADVDMTEAYDYYEPSVLNERKTLTILDGGFDLSHEDTYPGWIYNLFDVCGDNEFQPVSDLDPNPSCDFEFSNCWHGTAVLGRIAAATNNELGMAGINNLGYSMTRFYLIKIWGQYGMVILENALYGLVLAGGKPPRSDVVTCSWGQYFEDPLVRMELDKLYSAGIPVFFASGNAYITPQIAFPAYLPTVMAVASTRNNDTHAYDSPLSDSLDIAAPGYRVWSWDLTGPAGANPALGGCNGDEAYYCNFSGTSMATPLVAGVAAKLLLRRPDLADSSAERIYRVLRMSADDLIPEGFDDYYGWGRVNADRALLAVTRGDANNSGTIDVDDIVYLIGYIFESGAEPQPRFLNGDANCSGDVDIDDVIYLVGYMFSEGPAPIDCFVY